MGTMKTEREIRNIQINMIKPNNYQPRKYFSQDSLLELSQSIKEYGVLQPISVRKNGEKFYELVAGERRLRASQLAGLLEIPAIVIDMNDTESAVLALIENLQREDLNYIEEAEGYYNLIKEHGFTQEELAVRIGKKQSTIANKLRILKLPDDIKEKIIKEGLTERHARALLKLNDEKEQIKVIDEIVKNTLNVKKSEELIEREIKSMSKSKDLKKNKPDKALNKAKYKWSISPKIIVNTIKQIMDKNGISADYSSKEKEDCMEIIVRIPKA
jgi:ParB family chromosome partitioning protein